MLTTTNYKFKKPELIDSPPDITVTNPNWDYIDNLLKQLEDAKKTWDLFKTTGGTVNGDIDLVKLGITTHLGYSGFTPVASGWSVKGGAITTPVGVNLAVQPGQWSALLPFVDNDLSLGNEFYKYKDIFVGGSSKGVNGYTKLPNGLILQWGWIATPSEGGYVVTLPITFPNGIFRVLTSVDSTSFHNVRTYSAATSRFNLATTGGNAETSISWIALGY